jgi:hypothetical protein
MEFTKHFCRLVTQLELDDDDVLDYFDIVQSVVANKLVTVYASDEKIQASVIAYNTDDGAYVYEIVLEDQIDLDEGESISDMLLDEFDFDFEFETSMEI